MTKILKRQQLFIHNTMVSSMTVKPDKKINTTMMPTITSLSTSMFSRIVSSSTCRTCGGGR